MLWHEGPRKHAGDGGRWLRKELFGDCKEKVREEGSGREQPGSLAECNHEDPVCHAEAFSESNGGPLKGLGQGKSVTSFVI